MGAAVGLTSLFWSHECPQDPKHIFEGVTYVCERLEPTEEGKGLLHVMKVDLAAPGIELYVTPLDPKAVAQGWQYRLRWIREVVKAEHLAVAINATLFTSRSRLWPSMSDWRFGPRMPGDLARSVETVVADHVVSHVWQGSYLLGFDDQLAPHLPPSRPPTPAELKQAKWGIGGQAIWLKDGKVWLGSSRVPDGRTAMAIDA